MLVEAILELEKIKINIFSILTVYFFEKPSRASSSPIKHAVKTGEGTLAPSGERRWIKFEWLWIITYDSCILFFHAKLYVPTILKILYYKFIGTYFECDRMGSSRVVKVLIWFREGTFEQFGWNSSLWYYIHCFCRTWAGSIHKIKLISFQWFPLQTRCFDNFAKLNIFTEKSDQNDIT